MSNENNESGNKAIEAIASLRSGTGVWSTVQGDDFEAKKAVLAAVTNAAPVSESLGASLELVNVVTQAVTITDDKTGESNDAVRVILMTADGNSYSAVSSGLLGSLRDIFGILGEPSTWTEPLPVKVVEIKGRSGYRFMKIELV